ncbi:hypothetical protein EGJ52_24990 [Pseudomonas luteola]|nr:hypothetical protein EGJ52_24990 [Pseudomonas luteola]
MLYSGINGVIWQITSEPGPFPRSLFTALLKRFHQDLRRDGRIDLSTSMVDSTSIRATRAAWDAVKKRRAMAA